MPKHCDKNNSSNENVLRKSANQDDKTAVCNTYSIHHFQQNSSLLIPALLFLCFIASLVRSDTEMLQYGIRFWLLCIVAFLWSILLNYIGVYHQCLMKTYVYTAIIIFIIINGSTAFAVSWSYTQSVGLFRLPVARPLPTHRTTQTE
jgi:hypothetical protein